MNISFLTSGHYPFDDRIFFHMAKSLFENGDNIEVASSKIDMKNFVDGISLNCFFGDNLSKNDKIKHFILILSDFSPDIIICSEPLTILAAKKYAKRQSKKIKIVYDITEWYPSKKNLNAYKYPLKIFQFLKFTMFNIYASCMADAFIFGEWYKSKPFRFIFSGKPFAYITYYPDLKYIVKRKPEFSENKIRLSYSGKITSEKGFNNFISVLKVLSEYQNNLKIEAKIIGWYENERDKEKYKKLIQSLNENINLSFHDKQSFCDFINLINDSDIFLDLRSTDFENRHCLPIKLFYYAALERPVIFSNSKAIRKEVEISKFGFLVEPTDTNQIVKIILRYLENPNQYYEHCMNARNLTETHYNWEKLKPAFSNFIHSL
ncbi:MAG: glycosyltransferase [Bacteroidales bacterium]